MNVERYTFDTNILFYALDSDAGEKHRIASLLLGQADYEYAVLLLQSLCELCNAIGKKRPSALPLAYKFLRKEVALFDIAQAVPSDLMDAIVATQEHNISFWDAMFWATARRAGCTILLSEDFQDGRILGGVTVRNPFAASFDLDEF